MTSEVTRPFEMTTSRTLLKSTSPIQNTSNSWIINAPRLHQAGREFKTPDGVLYPRLAPYNMDDSHACEYSMDGWMVHQAAEQLDDARRRNCPPVRPKCLKNGAAWTQRWEEPGDLVGPLEDDLRRTIGISKKLQKIENKAEKRENFGRRSSARVRRHKVNIEGICHFAVKKSWYAACFNYQLRRSGVSLALISHGLSFCFWEKEKMQQRR